MFSPEEDLDTELRLAIQHGEASGQLSASSQVRIFEAFDDSLCEKSPSQA
jgi:RecA-family ATPase